MEGLDDFDYEQIPDQIEVGGIVYNNTRLNYDDKNHALVEAQILRRDGYLARTKKIGSRWYVFKARKEW
ncbi:MAG: hypothetical protein ACXAEN_18500 [Candidatus Thorarchaeota archaeon]|jgi:hypothetical protein